MIFDGPGNKDAIKRTKGKGWASEKDSGEGTARRTGRRVSGLIVGVGAERGSIERTDRTDAGRAAGRDMDRDAARSSSRSTDTREGRSADASIARGGYRRSDRSTGRSAGVSTGRRTGGSYVSGPGRYKSFGGAAARSDSSSGLNMGLGRHSNISEGQEAGTGFNRYGGRDRNTNRNTGRDFNGAASRNPSRSFDTRMDKYSDRGTYKGARRVAGSGATGDAGRYKTRDTGRDTFRKTPVDAGWRTDRNPSAAPGADDQKMDVMKNEVHETEHETDASRTPGYIPDEIIEGRNPVLEALKAGRTINKILVAKGEKEGSIKQVMAIARENGVIVQEVSRIKLDNMSATHGHQGVMALISAREYADFDEMVQAALSSEKQAFILILDGIEDPYNLGSIIRTADAAGVQGIVIPKRRAVGLTGAVAKASAGAIEYVPVARVTNIAVCIDQLKEKGFWIAGADSVSGEELSKVDLKGPIVLVVGGEDSGLGRLVKEKCDYVLHIPMKGRMSSLNTSVAAGIIMYEIVRQRMSGV